MNINAAIQQSLLHAIFCDENEEISDVLNIEKSHLGLKIYRANLRATALQALKISFPTVEALIGEQLMSYASDKLLVSFSPEHGNWSRWGSSFPDVLANLPELEEYPFVADCARLDYVCHQLVRDDDYIFEQSSISLLQTEEPDNIKVQLMPSLTAMESDFPIADIRSAHQLIGQEREDKLASIVEKSTCEKFYILCFRSGVDVVVKNIPEIDYQWLQLLEQHSLGKSLELINLNKFSLNDWFLGALQNHFIHKFYIC